MVTKNGETREKPRIISEIKKTGFNRQRLTSFISTASCANDFPKAKISGWIYWKAYPGDWILGWAEVKGGNLFVGPGFRIPLLRLHLQSCSAPKTFKLFRGPETAPFIFRTPSEETYEMWVKTLAVELMKQTPLQSLPFFDITSITRDLVRLEKTSTEAKKNKKNRSVIGAFFSKATSTWREKIGIDFRASTSGEPGGGEEYVTENISWGNISCVSVSEKKKFFESLNSGKQNESRQQTDFKNGEDDRDAKGKPVPVREMKRLFEIGSDNSDLSTCSTEKFSSSSSSGSGSGSAFALLDKRRLQRGERKLTKLKIQMAQVEETSRTVARDLETVTSLFLLGNEKEELTSALSRKLQQENCRLERLREEIERVLKENHKIVLKLSC